MIWVFRLPEWNLHNLAEKIILNALGCYFKDVYKSCLYGEGEELEMHLDFDMETV